MRRARGLGPHVVATAVGLLAVVALGHAPAVAASTPVEDPSNPATYDPYFAEQWALQAVDAPAAWSRSTGAGIRIGVIDTGVDLAHEDLAGKVVAAAGCVGANDVEAACTGSAQDDQGHGTHVAGIAAADTANGKGVASVAPGATIVAVKALGSNGSGALNDVNAGIKWAVDHGARVINLSLESDGQQVSLLPGQSLTEGVEYAWAHGAIPVVAAGNAAPSLFGPQGYAGIDAVVVGATGPHAELAWYSSPLTGAKWGIVAPGGDSRGADGTPSCAGSLAAGCIVSTGWFAGHANSYADDEGTSMATPEVSGVLALLLADGLTPTQAVDRMLATARRIACGDACHGLLDASAAVGAAPPPPPPTSTTVVPTTRPPTRTAVPARSAPPVSAVAPTTATPSTAPPTTRAVSQQGSVHAALVVPTRTTIPRPATRHGVGALPVVVAIMLLLGVGGGVGAEAVGVGPGWSGVRAALRGGARR